MTKDRIIKAQQLHERIGFEPDAAVDLFLLVADCLERGELPPAVACAWLVNAARATGEVDGGSEGRPVEHVRAARLATELGVVKRAGAPMKFVSAHVVRRAVMANGDNVSETKLSKAVAKAYGVSLGTARERVKSTKQGIAEAHEWLDAVMAASGIECLVEPRGGAFVRHR